MVPYTLASLAEQYVTTPEDPAQETLLKEYALYESLKIMKVCVGPYGSDHGIRPLRIVAQTQGLLHCDEFDAALSFDAKPQISKPLESQFILSPELFAALNLDLNAIARGVQNCVAGTSHYLHLTLVPKIPLRREGVHDEPGWDVYSMPNDLRLHNLRSLPAPLEDKVATTEFITWGNPKMHGDSSEHVIKLYLTAPDQKKLAAFPKNYLYKLFMRVDAQAPVATHAHEMRPPYQTLPTSVSLEDAQKADNIP